jgi:hypothetical protein
MVYRGKRAAGSPNAVPWISAPETFITVNGATGIALTLHCILSAKIPDILELRESWQSYVHCHFAISLPCPLPIDPIKHYDNNAAGLPGDDDAKKHSSGRAKSFANCAKQ